MSVLLDELLAGYVLPIAQMPLSHDTAAKAANPANPANSEAACGLAAGSAPCEGLRISANLDSTSQDSQTFAAVRKPQNGPQSQQACGFSQDSQGVGGTSTISATAGAWTDGDVGRFQDRRARLMRWGWSEQQAEALAERLVRRDHEQDDRRLCLECRHYLPGQCDNHQRAALSVADVGRDFATMMQRCGGFEPAPVGNVRGALERDATRVNSTSNTF